MKSLLIILAITVVYLTTRVVHLDQDAPPFWITMYWPLDELYTTIPALNLFHHGSWVYRPFPLLPPDELPFAPLLNLATFLSLLIFGNTFVGLRFPAVVCGALIIVAVVMCIRRVDGETPRRRGLIALLCSVYMLADFFFLASNRFAEHTIFSISAVALAMVTVTTMSKAPPPGAYVVTISWGLLAGICVTFFYVYTAPVAAALGATAVLLRLRKGWASALIHAGLFVVGAAVGVGLFMIFLRLAYAMDLGYYLAMMRGIGGRGTNRMHSIQSVSQAIDVIRSSYDVAAYQNISHNLFRYNPALLFAFLLALPLFLIRAWRKRDALDVFVVAFFVARYALSVYMPYDWYERKLMQVFPCVLYVIAVAALDGSRIAVDLVKHKTLRLAGAIVLVLAASTVTYRMMKHEILLTHRPPDLIAQSWFWVALALSPLLFLAGSRARTTSSIAMLLALSVPNVSLSYGLVYGNPTFKYRDALVQLAPELDGKILAGGLSFAVRLYNRSVPAINFYNYYFYGIDKSFELSRELFESHRAYGTVLYMPLDKNPKSALGPIVKYVADGGLTLARDMDIGDASGGYRLGLFVVPAQRRAP